RRGIKRRFVVRRRWIGHGFGSEICRRGLEHGSRMTTWRSEELVIAVEDDGARLDRVLASRVAELSRSRHKALILAGHVAIDGATIRDPGHRVNAGGTIRLELPPPEDAAIHAENIPLKVVYEDDDLIVIDKPPGLVVHPAAGNWTGTLVNA